MKTLSVVTHISALLLSGVVMFGLSDVYACVTPPPSPEPSILVPINTPEDLDLPDNLDLDVKMADETFQNYVLSVRAGEPWSMYQRFHTVAFIDKTEQQIADYTPEKKKALTTFNRMILSCQRFDMVGFYYEEVDLEEDINKKIIASYSITDICDKEGEKLDSNYYRDVTFAFENGWKIDNFLTRPIADTLATAGIDFEP